MRAPRSLASRLVVTSVALVLVVVLLVGGATALVMQRVLTDRLDQQVRDAVRSATEGPPGPPGAPGAPDGQVDLRNQAPGTLLVSIGGDAGDDGRIVGDRPGESTPVPRSVIEVLGMQEDDDRVRGVDLGEIGDYRVAGVPGGAEPALVVGLPTDDVDDAVRSLLVVEAGLALLGVVVAALAGRIVVRRQLRPLTEVAGTANTVATLPLASGQVGVTERVPGHLTDVRTEVGQVGAALNALLAHIEGSLDARHRSEQQVRQFVADASHELRTPLATIAGYAELARRRPDDAAASATALAKVEEEAARMTSLVEDLLLLARLDAGRPLADEPVDLTRLLLEAVADARVLAPSHVWRLDLPATAVEVRGDEQRLHQVVTNLLTNARLHTPAGSTVTVRATGHGLVVHDDGPGFAARLVADDGRAAFERFARGDAGRSREAGTGGSGLGLALVAAIVGAHGGTVGLRSVPGDTTIEVSLPVAPAAE